MNPRAASLRIVASFANWPPARKVVGLASPWSDMRRSEYSRSARCSSSEYAVIGTSYPSPRPAQLGTVRGTTPAARTKSVHICTCSESSSPLATRALVHASITSARAADTWVVTHTRGFHMTVIGILCASAMSAVFFIASSLEASPSKSSVHTAYSGSESTISFVATATSAAASRSTTSMRYVPGATPLRSNEPPYTLPAPVGASGASVPVERSRRVGAVGPGSASNTTSSLGVTDEERASGTRYQRRGAASKRARTATPRRGNGVGGGGESVVGGGRRGGAGREADAPARGAAENP